MSGAPFDPNTCGAVGHQPQGGGQGFRLFGVLPDFNCPPIISLSDSAPLGFLTKTHPVGALNYGNPNGLLMKILRGLQLNTLTSAPQGVSKNQQEYEADWGGDSGIRPLDTPAVAASGDAGGIHLD